MNGTRWLFMDLLCFHHRNQIIRLLIHFLELVSVLIPWHHMFVLDSNSLNVYLNDYADVTANMKNHHRVLRNYLKLGTLSILYKLLLKLDKVNIQNNCCKLHGDSYRVLCCQFDRLITWDMMIEIDWNHNGLDGSRPNISYFWGRMILIEIPQCRSPK